MYVCVCNGLTDRDFTYATHAGAATVGQAFGLLAEKPQCGKCFTCARQCIADARIDMTQRSMPEAAE